MYLFTALARNPLFILAHSGRRYPEHWTYPTGVILFSLITPYLSSFCTLPYYLVQAWRDSDYPNRLLNQLSFDSLISFVWFFLFIAGWLWIFERRGLRSTGFIRPKWGFYYLRGLGVGVLLMSQIVALLMTGGNVQFSLLSAPNLKIIVWGISFMFIGFVIQGAAEEILARGFLLPIVGTRFGVFWGILLSSMVFSLLHLLNPNLNWLAVLNLFLFGLFAALFALWEENLWGICGVHTAWNWTQGCFFGLFVSGVQVQTSLFQSQITGPSWWNGGNFGPEGGLATTLVLSLGIVFLTWRLIHNADKEKSNLVMEYQV